MSPRFIHSRYHAFLGDIRYSLTLSFPVLLSVLASPTHTAGPYTVYRVPMTDKATAKSEDPVE